MKNLTRIMALVLCMLLVFPAALAQEAAYTAGQPTTDAFVDAFASGKLVTAQIALDLELNAQTLELTDGEAQIAKAVLDTLRQTNVTLGAGLIEQGVRIAFEAELTDAAGANPVRVNALADVTPEGIAVESDVIPGKRVSAAWETILALCGLDESEIAMVMSLRDADADMVAQMIAELMAEIEPMIEMAAQLAMPYAETVVNFVLSLPIEVRENLTEENYPPTATEVSITITEKDLGTLVTLLCDQLDQDATLKVILNSLLEQSGAETTVEEMLVVIRGDAEKMTNTDTPVTFYLGMNEADVPVYAEVYVYNEPSGESLYGGLFLYQDADGVWQFELVGGLYDEESSPMVMGYIGTACMIDPADSNVYTALFEMHLEEEGTPLMEMTMTIDGMKAESELPTYDTNVAMSMFIDDGEEDVQMVASAAGRQGMTAAGGESSSVTSTTDVYVGEVTTTQTETVEQLVEPTQDGGVAGYTKVTETMPASGIDQLEMNVVYASEAIDMAASHALAQIAFETATEDDMNALMMEALTVISEEKLPAVMSNLPAEMVQMIEENIQ